MAKRGSSQWMQDGWGPPGPHGLVTWNLTPKKRVTTKRELVPVFQRVAAIMDKYGYPIRPDDTWSYNFRKIRGGRGWSSHAFGCALDINANTNPMTSPLKTDMPAAMIAEIKAIKTVDGLQVLRWGGDYSGRKDAMHFEAFVTRRELARGLAGPPPPASSQPKPILREDEDMLKHGDRGPAVAKLQMTINGILARSERLHPAHEDVPQIAVDGIWGNDTTRGLTHAHARAQQVCNRDYGPHWSPAQVDLMDAALLSEAVSRLGDLEAAKAS